MDINYAKNQITLYGKVCRIDTLLKKLASLSGNQVYNFLIDRTTQLPRKLNCLAMISVLNNKIKFLHSNSLPKDSFAKLQYYEHFSEQQLFMLFNKICDKDDFLTYRSNLWTLILENYKSLALNDGELMYLKNLNKQTMEDFPGYFNFITGACLEQDNTFDGMDMDDLKENLQYSASNQDVFDLAGKYGIPLPQRLKKEEYLDYIFDYLKRKGSYSEEIVNELNAMNITQISTYARRTGIPMQPNMSKSELITYLFYFLDLCEIPTTSVVLNNTADKYKPLEFRVDLQAIDSFGNSENKKIIYYQGDTEDQESLTAILNQVEEEPVVEEVIPEPKVEEKKNAKKEADNSWTSILKTFEDEKKKAEEEAKAQAEEEILAEDIINETLAQIPEKEEVIEEPRIEIDVKKVDVNPELGTGEIEKLAQSKSVEIAIWISLALALGIVAFCIIGMLLL